MTRKPKPLINRLPIRSNESLPSYFEYLAAINHYDPKRILYSHIRELASAPRDSLFRTSNPAVFQAISDLSGISLDFLYEVSNHRFAEVVTPPNIALDYLQLGQKQVPRIGVGVNRKELHPDYEAKFCPYCLQEGLYHRIHWWPVAISACLEHACLLVDQCPQCKGMLSTLGVASGVCKKCGSDLQKATAIMLEDDPFGLTSQAVIQSWLIKREIPENLASIPTANLRVLYRLLDGFRFIAMSAGEGWKFLHLPTQLGGVSGVNTRSHMTPSQSYQLYATGYKALIDWPEGFHSFLEAYTQRRTEKRNNDFGILGGIYYSWLTQHWKHSEFGFVQQAFNEYLINHAPAIHTIAHTKHYKAYRDTLEVELEYLTLTDACRILSLKAETIRHMLKEGYLKRYPSAKKKAVLLYRTQIEALKQQLHKTIKKIDVENQLGISPHFLDQLVAVKLLSPVGEQRFFDTRFHRTEIKQFCRALAKLLIVTKEKHKQAMSISNATQISGRIGIGVAQLLISILDGELRAYISSSKLRQLDEIWLDRTDVTNLVNHIKQKNDWINFGEVCLYLGVGRVTLHQWINKGILQVVATFSTTQYFSRQAITQFKQRMMTSNEVAKFLGVRRKVVSVWAHAGEISAVCGPNIDGSRDYRFDRAYIEAWNEKYLIAAKVKKELNVIGATL